MGLLEKMINPSSGHPVWVAMGYRGNGTNAATCKLVLWWKDLGKLYGKKPFGLLLKMNDQNGWQQSKILKLHPQPKWHVKLIHHFAWKKMKRAMVDDSIEYGSQLINHEDFTEEPSSSYVEE